MTKEQRRFAPTRVSEITGLGVQIEMESVSGFDWTDCPDSVEYAYRECYRSRQFQILVILEYSHF
jgi:hypothetical protein